MNARAIQTGANPQTTRQNFIDAEVAKAGSMNAFEGKYGIGESVIETWVDHRAWGDLSVYKSDNFRAGVPASEWADMDHQARLITRGLNKLDRAYMIAGGDD